MPSRRIAVGLLMLMLMLMLGLEIAGGASIAKAAPFRPADAGPAPADAGAVSSTAALYIEKAAQIRSLIAQTPSPSLDPQSLFELPLETPEDQLRLERERLERLLAPSAESWPRRLAQADSSRMREAGDAGAEPPLDPNLWRARLELDRARLAFYSLPTARRAALLQIQRERRQQALAHDHDLALTESERAARRAEEQQRQALEAARLASTEAARLVNEEYARLLAVTRAQAQYESAMIQRRAKLDGRAETVLGWRRRVAELLSAPLDTAARTRIDRAYDDLRGTLRQARALLSDALASIGDGAEKVPQAGRDPLLELPVEVDRHVAIEQRRQVVEKARELGAAERELELVEARQLMSEVETLNRLRLDLLSGLSFEKRSGVLGFGPPGWDQAASEVRQVLLTLRFHLRAAYEWAREIKSGNRRGSSAWLAFVLLVKWALPIGLFAWWRRRADLELERLRQSQREKARRKRDGNWFRINDTERAVAFLKRVHAPLEWLLLIGLITWVLPAQLKGLLEVRLASTALLWIFGGLFIVLAIDALSADRARPSPLASSSLPLDTGSLRLRSLRLVGRATVAFGLVLSLTELLVGRGTIYDWVFSTCWFAALPVLSVIIAWWRPFIFERFARTRRPNSFELWVLANRQPPEQLLASLRSSLAAIAGGVYLFALGAVRAVRSRILSFELTRRLLAYLFRRDLSKKARASESMVYSDLEAEAFQALGPEVSSKRTVRNAADAEFDQVIQEIQSERGGAIAIVGERGAGKTTLIQRILESCAGPIVVRCKPWGASELRLQLNHALGLPPDTTFEAAAQSLDGCGDDRALLLDDAQYLLRLSMGGLAELDQVLSTFRRHSRRCTWILAFDVAVWRFVERARGAQPLFDRVIRLNPWSEEAIVRLIHWRNESAGVEPDFSGLAPELRENDDALEVLDALRSTEANYYRLLWDYASGNPGVALHFWRRSLRVAEGGRVLVRLFEAPDMAHLEALPDSAAFVLRAIIQLGWANPDSIRHVTSLSQSQVEDALRYGSQRGYFEMDGDCYRINWDWFRAVTRLLERRHLSFSAS